MRRGALLALLLVGCQGPVSGPAPAALGGDFASSQLKPRWPARAALSALAPSTTRQAAQQSYFAALARGEAPSKAALLGSAGPPLAAGLRDLRAGPMVHVARLLAAGQALEVETRGLSAGADPVLHLWHREAGREVARDDDSGREPGAARLGFRAAEAGTYLVLPRAYSGQDEGRCDLYLDGERVAAQIGFGGTSLPWRPAGACTPCLSMTARATSPGLPRAAPPATRSSPGSSRGPAPCSPSTTTAAWSSARSWRRPRRSRSPCSAPTARPTPARRAWSSMMRRSLTATETGSATPWRRRSAPARARARGAAASTAAPPPARRTPTATV